MRMLPLIMLAYCSPMRSFVFSHRHQGTEHREAWPRIAFDNPAMVADDLGDERQTKSRAVKLGGDERIEEMRHEISRNAGAVIFDCDLERETHSCLTSRHRETHAGPERRCERNLSVRPILADRLRRVLHEIEEYLDQLIATSRHRWQRRIVILHNLDFAGEASTCDLLHVVEHVVDIDRLALNGALITEDLHAVDQLADAI